MSLTESGADTLRRAAARLRAALDPDVTPHAAYQRLMLDLHWPIALAEWLESEAKTVDAAEPIARKLDLSATQLLQSSVHAEAVARAILRDQP